jgi:hypothetical protein|tara:strand:- start:7 stop:516 length:510 start_codon:yes stop_codon:yes gene_type:complete
LGDVWGWKMVALVFVAVSVLLGLTSLLLYGNLVATEERYDDTIESLDKISFSMDILFNYGNGTLVWYNDTRLPIGVNFYNVTVLVSDGRLDATYYPEYRSHFISSINGVGVADDPDKLYWAWIAWFFDEGLGEWIHYDVSVDLVYPKEGDILAWYFEDTSNYPDYVPPI